MSTAQEWADAAPLRTTYAPSHPVNLALILRPLVRGHHDPTMRTDISGIWRTVRSPLGPATMHLARRGTGIEVSAWGAGAEWAIEGVPELLGAGDDWSDLDVSGSPLLADSLHRNPGLRLLRTRQVFEMMLAAIFEQKVTGVQARHSWRVLITKYGSPAPGPAPAGMRVFPAAETWRRVPSWEWHRAGVGPERSAAAVRAAVVAASLERTLELGRGGVGVERALRSIPGVGVWTAAETMQRAHGDPDSPSVGDYHLPALVGWALAGRPVDDHGMLELLAPWAGHRQRIMRLIESSGFTKPRFGPRMTVQDHRGH
ncbi:MAG: DNA-3-methyladenine glycosylase 2 family protein [Rhodoglobus sp.]|nr:DNA-3-methyladenine glycosylase 2 family protein [Rhodoglobus sp.]